jgi:DNA gyrase/topoisomerase IV subunit A
MLIAERNLNCARQKRAHLRRRISASDNIDEVIALIKASKKYGRGVN